MTGKAEETRRTGQQRIRFHHRRDRFVRLRPRRPACLRAQERRAADRGGPSGQRSLDPHSGRLYRNIYNPKLASRCKIEPAPELYGRRVSRPRGKLLGGSSSIGGLIYIRGHRQEFDLRRRRGNTGWSYDVLAYFHRTEDQEHVAPSIRRRSCNCRASDRVHCCSRSECRLCTIWPAPWRICRSMSAAVSGNANATVIMIAEKEPDAISHKRRLLRR